MEPFYVKSEDKLDYSVPSDSFNTGTSHPSTMMTTPQLNRSRNEGVVPDFIQKLFNMLESTDDRSCFHWGRQGTTFVIDDTNEFSRTILPRRFKHGNFSSFVRQLNKYDFHKIRFTDNKSISSVNQQAWEFQHPLFRRDRKHLLAQIRRKVNNNRGQQTKQRQSTNKSSSVSPSPSTASSSSIPKDLSDDNTVNTNASTATNMQYMHDIHSSLQAQIDKLASDQQSMQSTLTRLLTTDTLLLDELHGLKRKMDEKDSIFSAALEQSKHQRTYHPLLQQQQQQQQQQNDKLLPHHPSDDPSPPISIPQSPSLKLLPWLQPPATPEAPILSTASSSSSSTTPSYTPSSSSVSSLSFQPPPNPALLSMPMNPAPSQPDLGDPSSQPGGFSTIPTSPAQPPQPLTLASSPSGSPSSSSGTTLDEPAHTTCHRWRHRPKVLVVEDNVMYRRISMRCLQRLGCDFDLACDGLEAVSCMKTSQYDLILMDISIPKLDGMAATRKLRQYDQHTPVVSMTANYSDHDIENYVGSGMSDLLPKPFDQHKLYDILKQHCAHLV